MNDDPSTVDSAPRRGVVPGWAAAAACGLATLIFFILLSPSIAADPAPGASAAKTLSEAQQQRLKERDGYWQEATKAAAAGKLPQAIAAGEKAVAIEREVLGNGDLDVAGSLDYLASLHERQQDFPAARALREESLAIKTKLLGKSNWQVADARRSLDDIAILEKLTPRQCGELADAAQLEQQLIGQSRAGKFDDALASAKRVLEIRQAIYGPKHSITAISLSNLGSVAADMGDYPAARKYQEQALALRREVLGEKHPKTAASLENLGVVEMNMGDYAAARKCYEESLEIRREVLGEKHPFTAISLNYLGIVADNLGDFAAARKYDEEALAIRRAVFGEKHPDTATSLNDLAAVADEMGDYTAARKYNEQALAIRRAVLGQRHPDTAASLSNLGIVADETGDFAAARKYHEEALAIRRALFGEKHPDTAASLNNLGAVATDMGDFAAARKYHEQALAIRLAVLGPKHRDTADSLTNLGNVADDLGDYAAAKNYHEQALAIYRAIDGETHPDTAAALNNLGSVAMGMGDFAAARKNYEQALAIYRAIDGEWHPDTAAALNNLGSVAMGMGDFAAARKDYEQALAIKRLIFGDKHPETARSLRNLGRAAAALRDFSRAKALILESLHIYQSQLELTAAVQSERQQLRMSKYARSYLDDYLSVTDKTETPAEEVYAEVLIWKGAVSARQQGMRRLRDSLANGQSPQTAKLFDELSRATRELANRLQLVPKPDQLEAHRQKLAALGEQVERLQRQLADASQEFRGHMEQQRRSPADIRHALPPKTVLVDLLEYAHYSPQEARAKQSAPEDRLVAFVVRPDQPVERIELGPVAPIAAAIESWRKTYGSGPDGQNAAGDLRRLVWAKIEPSLQGANTILLSPDGATAKFPWPALPGSKPETYLIEEVGIAIIPIPRLLPELLAEGDASATKQPTENPSLLVVGEVDFDADAGKAPVEALALSAPRGTPVGGPIHWPALPGTRTEIVAIADSFEQQFPDAALKKLRGDKATKGAVISELAGHRFVHLATHGFFAPPQLKSAALAQPSALEAASLSRQDIVGYYPGLLSGLVLAGANRPAEEGEDDGILTALEVESLDLRHVELATLSACETGLGKSAGGEGLLGLQRAFQVSGAKCVVATLWTIRDDASRSLMIDFYENLWKKKMTKLEALRQAQLSMLREGIKRGMTFEPNQPAEKSHRLPPYYWAAFTLSGNWN